MAEGVNYSRRTRRIVIVQTPKIAEILPDWKGGREVLDVRLAARRRHRDRRGPDVPGRRWPKGCEVHAVVTTDGRMGYCRFAQRRTITKIRRGEAEQSFEILGLPPERLHFLQFPDCNLNPYRGRHFATIGDPTEVEGASGLQNAYPAHPPPDPAHAGLPAHQHRPAPRPSDRPRGDADQPVPRPGQRSGRSWARRSTRCRQVYEFATYCDFPEPPQLRIDRPAAMLETKLEAIRAYASQEQIDLLVDVQRNVGPVEYLREVEFHFYSPQQYDAAVREDRTDAAAGLLPGRRQPGRGGQLPGRDHDALRPGLRPRAEHASRPGDRSREEPYALYVVSDYPAGPVRRGGSGVRWPACVRDGARAW